MAYGQQGDTRAPQFDRQRMVANCNAALGFGAGIEASALGLGAHAVQDRVVCARIRHIGFTTRIRRRTGTRSDSALEPGPGRRLGLGAGRPG